MAEPQAYDDCSKDTLVCCGVNRRQKALDSLHRLPEGKYKDSLVSMVGYVLQRIY
jgi:hypothetical protein